MVNIFRVNYHGSIQYADTLYDNNDFYEGALRDRLLYRFPKIKEELGITQKDLENMLAKFDDLAYNFSHSIDVKNNGEYPSDEDRKAIENYLQNIDRELTYPYMSKINLIDISFADYIKKLHNTTQQFYQIDNFGFYTQSLQPAPWIYKLYQEDKEYLNLKINIVHTTNFRKIDASDDNQIYFLIDYPRVIWRTCNNNYEDATEEVARMLNPALPEQTIPVKAVRVSDFTSIFGTMKYYW